MADYKFSRDELRDRRGSKVAVLDGKHIRDHHGKKLGEIDGKYFRDSHGAKLAEFDGRDVRDSRGSKIATIDDVKKSIDGNRRRIARCHVAFLRSIGVYA
jgi:sporulation protein YlmC with PRC-barrel domain